MAVEHRPQPAARGGGTGHEAVTVHVLTLFYGFVLVAASFVMCLFGFFVGRCARKLPVIDDKLPWA